MHFHYSVYFVLAMPFVAIIFANPQHVPEPEPSLTPVQRYLANNASVNDTVDYQNHTKAGERFKEGLKGAGEGIVDPVKEFGEFVMHPVEGVENIGRAVAHPNRTVNAIKEKRKECYATKSETECNTEFAFDVGVGFAAPELLPETIPVMVADKTSKAGFVSGGVSVPCEEKAKNGTCLVYKGSGHHDHHNNSTNVTSYVPPSGDV